METTNQMCKQIEESLDAFHDNELSAAEQRVVEDHLQNCAACVNKLAEIDRLVHTLRTMPRVAVSESLSSKLDNIIDQQTNVSKFPSKLWMPVAAAAAVVAIVFGLRFANPIGTPGTTHDTIATKPGQPVPTQSPDSQLARSLAASNPSPPSMSKSTTDNQAVAVQKTPSEDSAKQNASNKPSLALQAGNENYAEQRIAVTSKEVGTEIAYSRPDKPAANEASTAARLGNTTAITTRVSENYDDVVAELPNTQDSFADAVGLTTDEDGLYDIKM